MVRQSFPNAMFRPKDEIKAEAKIKIELEKEKCSGGFQERRG